MRCGREWRIGQRRHAGRIGVYERLFAGVPRFEQFLVGQTADQTGMDEAGEPDPGDVPGMRVEARNIPDRLLRQREVVGEKAAAVLLGEEAVEAPRALGKDADVENIDNEEIARLGAVHADRPGQKVHNAQINVAHIVGQLIVLDETSGPIVGLHHEVFARLDPLDNGNVRVPPIVDHFVFVGRFRKVNLHDRLGHFCSFRKR